MKIKKHFKIITTILLITSEMILPVQAITNTHFSDNFKYFDSSKWQKADGWSNNGMFNCTWRKENIVFSDHKIRLNVNMNIYMI